jgi:hypothetical protein
VPGEPLPAAARQPPSSPSLPAAPGLARVLLWTAPLLAANVGLLLLGDLALHLEAALVILAAGFAALGWASRRLGAAWSSGEPEAMLHGLVAGAPAAARRPPSLRAQGGVILGFALALRLPLLGLAPTLSGDLDRYLWDGRVAAAGQNPYRLAPDSPEIARLRDERWQRLGHRQIPTLYPPLAVALFAAVSALPAPQLAWKTLATLADLGGCFALLLLARRLGVPLARSLWYAWNPLVALEVSGMGHLDALGIAAAVAAVLAIVSARPVLAGWAAAAGALLKLAPAAALPLWSRASRRPGRFLAAACGALALLAAPVLLTTGLPPGLSTYAVSWEFNGPLFEPLWRALDASGADSAVARAVDRLKEWTGLHRELNRLYPYLYPQFLAKLLLAGGMLLVVIRTWRRGQVALATGRLFGGLLLCSATVYPWYVLWVLPWAALAGNAAWLSLSGFILLTYLPQHRAVSLWPGLFLVVWLPMVALAALGKGGWKEPAQAPPREPTRG